MIVGFECVRQDMKEGGTWEGKRVGDGRRRIKRGEMEKVQARSQDFMKGGYVDVCIRI